MDLQGLFVKNLILTFVVAVVLSGCGKKSDEIIVPKGNPQQKILTVAGKSVWENQTDEKLKAFLLFQPQATEEEIKGARKTIALSFAEEILVDEKLKEQNIVITEEELEQTKLFLDFVYKDSTWLEKIANQQGISTKELYRQNTVEYKKIKIISEHSAAHLPSSREILKFMEEERENYSIKPHRKAVYQILVRHKGLENPKSVERARQKIQKAQKALQEGADFQEIAKKYSDLEGDPSEFLGMIWEDCPYYGEEVAKMAWALSPGECSEIYSGEAFSLSLFYVKEEIPEENLEEEVFEQWARLLWILHENSHLYHLYFQEMMEEGEISYSLEYENIQAM